MAVDGREAGGSLLWIGLAMAAVAATYLVFVPVYAGGEGVAVEAGGTAEAVSRTESSQTLVEVNGRGSLLVVAVPVLVAGRRWPPGEPGWPAT